MRFLRFPLPLTTRRVRLALGLLAFGGAGGLRAEPLILPLWEGSPPGLVANAGPEVTDAAGTVGNISVPVIAVHLPPRAQATGAAFIVCPGGSYSRVGLFTSGMGTVDHFLPQGVAIIVLKYRTRPPSTDVVTDSLADARRAVRLARLHAAAWNIDPARIGLIGSSAGSHLVLNLATHWDRGDPNATAPVDRQSCRPDFIGLLCPWPNRQSVADFPVTRETPPAFVCSARDDQVAPAAFAESIAAAYATAGVNCRLWLIAKGGHTAFKLGTNRGEGSHWPEHFSAWLKLTLPSP
ncbi:alpha/beta hydrolase [Horticoccus sp. 23ND18S-11]|uniref:alpha/beta hydrolase n=1 Tax=Horticoccus sp. 23ND18S-11 TaxID=3391832 RepID=UPI0039C93A4F